MNNDFLLVFAFIFAMAVLLFMVRDFLKK